MRRFREVNLVGSGRGPSLLGRLVRRCVLSVLAATAPSLGAVVGTTAKVSTTVQELIDGVPGSVNADDAAFPAAGAELPLAASATLRSTDLNGALVSLAQGFSEFADPTRLDQPNPEEFALEIGCYSNAESISYSVLSQALESRSVIFARAGNPAAPPEISFGSSSARDVESRLFLSGAVVFWSTHAETNLDELRVELTVRVSRGDTPTPLFETALRIDGRDAAVSATGPIRHDRVGLDELAALGVDDATLAILRRVQDEGSLMVLVIPPQEHAYSYSVTADEELTLNADLEVRVRNAPRGTGIAAVLGRPFEELSAFIEKGLPGVDGEVVRQSLNKAISQREMGFVPSPDTARTIPSRLRTSPTPRLCGAGGVAMIGLSLSLGLWRTVTGHGKRRGKTPLSG
ncbi:MAG: hypothetical protein V1790_19755 [Planctomycetota bacterium]